MTTVRGLLARPLIAACNAAATLVLTPAVWLERWAAPASEQTEEESS